MTQILSKMSLISIVMLSLSCAKNPQSLNTVGAFEQTLGIINGTLTLPQNATALHTVAIGYRATSSKAAYSIEPFCTGIAISQDLIITAAHCIHDDVEYKTLNEVLIFFGLNTDTANQDNLRNISSVKLHPEYTVEFNELKKAVSTFNDIALINIKGTLPKSHHPAALVDNGLFLKKNSQLIVAGWGLLQVRPDMSAQQLFETTVQVSGYWRSHLLHDDQERKTAFCNGDSGGPGYVTVQNTLVLAGLVRGPHYPYPNCQGFGEFTNVGFHKDFILKASKELSATAPQFVQIPQDYLEQTDSKENPSY